MPESKAPQPVAAWAAVSPEGQLLISAVCSTPERAAAVAMGKSKHRSWPRAHEAGWRVIRVQVAPHVPVEEAGETA